MIGIYKIISPTDKVYIGQSWNINKRLSTYKNCNCKKQPKLQNSIKKHGWNAHKFEVIMELSDYITQSVLDTWEEYYIDLYRREGYNLLNIRDGGRGGRHSEESIKKMKRASVGKGVGRKLSDEHKRKISIGGLGRKNSKETKKKMSLSAMGIGFKPILQFSVDGLLIKEWRSATEVMNNLKISRGHIYNVCNGRSKTAGGFKWKHKE